jgi:hypothetical protein
MAAAASALAFGTFGVPIKSDAARSVDVDPLVFQSYKTLLCFATSWLVLLFGQSFEFTPWGIVSAIFWVPGYERRPLLRLQCNVPRKATRAHT